MRKEFDAAWVPFTADRTLEAAAAVAMKWAEKAAAVHNRPAVLVTDRIGEYHGHEPFERYRRGRHVSPRSSRLDFRPGAVIAHVPIPKALELATGLANGTALAVVEHPAPWRLAGWARAVGALDLLTGETAPALDPKLTKHLDDLIFYGNNGYSGARPIWRSADSDGPADRRSAGSGRRRQCLCGTGRVGGSSGGHRSDDRPDSAPAARSAHLVADGLDADQPSWQHLRRLIRARGGVKTRWPGRRRAGYLVGLSLVVVSASG